MNIDNNNKLQGTIQLLRKQVDKIDPNAIFLRGQPIIGTDAGNKVISIKNGDGITVYSLLEELKTSLDENKTLPAGGTVNQVLVKNSDAGYDVKWADNNSKGPQGIQGASGPKGDNGDIGPAGPAGPQGPVGDKGDTGAQGIPGTPGEIGPGGRTILSDTTEPTSAIGTDGDFYLNKTNLLFYGPKQGGYWGSGISIIGPVGPAGANGPAGAVGPTGPVGPIGPTGEKGPAGADGAPGATGARGATGAAGPAGLNGTTKLSFNFNQSVI